MTIPEEPAASSGTEEVSQPDTSSEPEKIFETKNTSGTEDSQKPKEKVQSFFKNPAALWIAVGAAALLYVVITVVLLGKRKKGKASSCSTTDVLSASQEGIRVANIQGVGARESQQDSFGVTDITDERRGNQPDRYGAYVTGVPVASTKFRRLRRTSAQYAFRRAG